MKSIILLIGCLSCIIETYAQKIELETRSVDIGTTSFQYHESSIQSESVVILFHDWFGVTDLSYEMAERIVAKGIDVIIIDLYKGKSAATNQEAGQLMNSIDQANMWEYLENVLKTTGENHEKIFVWGFSLGTVPASQLAIRNNEVIDGLILFYGNVTQDKEQIAKITFPALMVMGAMDNPAGAINFFNNVNASSGTVRLFIYPKARHAFAQKLFNAGANYDEDAKEASLQVTFRFLEEVRKQ